MNLSALPRVFLILFLLPSILWANRPTTLETVVMHLEDVATENLNKGIELYQKGERAEASEYFFKAYLEGKERDNIKLWTGALALHATMQLYARKSEEAERFYYEILDVPEERSDRFIRAVVQSSLAMVYDIRGENKLALKFQKAFLNWAENYQDDPFEVGAGLRTVGYQYLALEELDSAYTSFIQARNIHERHGHPVGLMRSYFALGLYNQKIDSYEEAIKNLILWLEKADEINYHKPQRVMIFVNLANNFMEIGNWDQAEDFAHKALDLADELNLTFYRAAALQTAGTVARHKGELLKAQELYEDCLATYESQGKKPKILETLMGLSNIMIDREDLDAAESTLVRAISLADSLDVPVYKWETRDLYGAVLMKKKRWNEARLILENANKLSIQFQDLAGEELSSRRLADVYSQVNKKDKAFKFLQRSSQLKDSLNDKNSRESARLLEARYRFAEQESALEQLDTENQILEVKSAANRRWLYLLVFALLILAGLMAALWKLYDKSRKQEKVIKETLVDREILLKEIHHRVKNNLQVISSLLSMHSRQISDPGAQQAMLEGRNRVKSMALIHQNLYGDDDLVNVKASEYIDKLIYSIIYSYKMDVDKIDIQIDVDDLQMDVDTMIPLGLVINELVSNAMKYAYISGEGSLSVSLKDKEDIYALVVHDSGPGFEQKTLKESGSLGYKIVNAFIKKLNATLSITNRAGAHVRIDIPK